MDDRPVGAAAPGARVDVPGAADEHARDGLRAGQEVRRRGLAPGAERWLEVSSCSTFRDSQARRMQIRSRPSAGAKAELVHTLNGSALGMPRTVAAILETYQQPDGTVVVPDALRRYLGRDVMGPGR